MKYRSDLPFGFPLNIALQALMVFMMAAACGGGASEDPSVLFSRAGEAFSSGNPAEAESLLILVTALDPQNANAWYNLGTVRMSMGDYQAAAESYRTVIEVDSFRVDALTDLTAALTGAGMYPEALEAGSLAVICNPTDGMAFNNYGRALLESGDPARAAEILNTALRRDPENPSILYNCGRISAMAGNLEGALAFFRRVTEIDPHHYGARLETARTLGMAGDHVEAQRIALVLTTEQPGEIEAMEILALALAGQERHAEA
ncbi:MAG TPA: tetratricopeptide repeat protein, partial [Candidatus Sabulitectum sp.]|nr:tetratricopeptide repeat protein [Candidatus Sabulitectum sp.]